MQSVISVAIMDLAQTTAVENISHMLHVMSSYLQHYFPLLWEPCWCVYIQFADLWKTWKALCRFWVN